MIRTALLLTSLLWIANPARGSGPEAARGPEAGRPYGWFPPGGIELGPQGASQKLTARVWLLNGSPQARFEVLLHGVGAPKTPFAAQTDAHDGHFVSGRIVSIKKEPLASFEASGLKAGGYVLELVYDGHKLAERTFNLIALPAKGGKARLDVDFSGDIYQAYILPTHYRRSEVTVVVPKDLRRAKTRYTLVQFIDSKVCSHASKDVETFHPSERSVLSLVYHDQLEDTLCVSASSPKVGDIDVVLLRDAGEFVHSWHIAGDQLVAVTMAQSSKAWVGPVASGAEPAQSLLEQAREISSASWHKDTDTANGHYADQALSKVRSEAMLCAVASNPRAALLVLNLAELGHTGYAEADRYERAKEVLASKYSTEKERAAAKTEKGAMVSGTVEVSAAVKKLKSELDAITKHYSSNCFRKLYPNAFQSFIVEKAD